MPLSDRQLDKIVFDTLGLTESERKDVNPSRSVRLVNNVDERKPKAYNF